MQPETSLTMGIDAFTAFDLLRRAAAHEEMELDEDARRAFSKPLKVYTLNKTRLDVLAKRGIVKQDRPDCQNRIFTLKDTNPKKQPSGGILADYWNFLPLNDDFGQFDMRVSLCIEFSIYTIERGIILMPQALGTSTSAAHPDSVFRMFKTLVESDNTAPAVAKELAASDGTIVISWTELGLGGIRRVSHLFFEFAERNEKIVALGRSNSVFNPAPSRPSVQPGDELFIAEPAQPKVIKEWQKQLENYRAELF